MNIINTQRLTLTPVLLSDKVFLSKLFLDNDVKKYYVLRDDHSNDIELFTKYLVETNQNGRALQCIVRLKNSTPIGLAGGELMRDLFSGEASWNTSYAIHPEYRGCGYATEAVIAFTNHVKQYAINKSYLDISDENEPSKCVARKAGYVLNKDTAHVDQKHLELLMLFHWEKQLHSQREILFNKATTAFRSKDYQMAENLYERALEYPYERGSAYTDAQCYSNIGMACSSYGNYTKAYQCLMKAKSMGLTNASIEKELAWLHNNKGIG